MKININNVSLNYIESGKPKSLAVVLIHGFPFSHKMWEPQLRVMPNNIYAIAYDIRGHGSSDVGDGQFTMEIFVDDLIALLNHLSIEKAVLCGLSMGGYIALRTFERHPERVAGLILCNTKSEPDTNEAKVKRTAAMNLIKTEGTRVFGEYFAKDVFCSKTFENKSDTIEFAKQIIRANSSLGICGTQLALASRTDTTPILSAINVPTCIIVGEQDKLTPPSTAQTMHKKITGSELHILPNAAHMSNLENANDFNETIIAFLKKHWFVGNM
jgi:pimeloyl-ACP methyl ester carboxylesterase